MASIGESFSAVVAGEDDQRVVDQAVRFERAHQPADAFVHVMDHAAVHVNVAAGQVEQVVFHRRRLGSVVACFPRPVWCGVVQCSVVWWYSVVWCRVV